MSKESCMNCAHKDRCLIRSAAIFHLYIQTGRYEEAKDAQICMDIRENCNSWEAKE